jgi:hypothetical protein
VVFLLSKSGSFLLSGIAVTDDYLHDAEQVMCE